MSLWNISFMKQINHLKKKIRKMWETMKRRSFFHSSSMSSEVIIKYVIYNKYYNILICHSYDFAISLDQIEWYLHEFHKKILIEIYNKIIQYANILFLCKVKEIMISSSKINSIIDLELIKDEFQYQFNNYLYYIIILDSI